MVAASLQECSSISVLCIKFMKSRILSCLLRLDILHVFMMFCAFVFQVALKLDMFTLFTIFFFEHLFNLYLTFDLLNLFLLITDLYKKISYMQ